MDLIVLAKLLKWGFANQIKVSIQATKIEGASRDAIEIILNKNGKEELIRLYDWEEFDRAWLQRHIEEKALNLSLTRLYL